MAHEVYHARADALVVSRHIALGAARIRENFAVGIADLNAANLAGIAHLRLLLRFFYGHLGRVLIVAQAQKTAVPDHAVGSELGEIHLCH